MHNLAIKQENKYTYKDYMLWDDSEYRELIDGIAYQMAPHENLNLFHISHFMILI